MNKIKLLAINLGVACLLLCFQSCQNPASQYPEIDEKKY